MDAPISPLTMAILLALAESEQHGYALMQEVGRQTGTKPGTGSLYAALQRLTEEGLVEYSANELPEGEDPRRRYFAITKLGRARARDEARRMLRVVDAARLTGLLPEAGRRGAS